MRYFSLSNIGIYAVITGSPNIIKVLSLTFKQTLQLSEILFNIFSYPKNFKKEQKFLFLLKRRLNLAFLIIIRLSYHKDM